MSLSRLNAIFAVICLTTLPVICSRKAAIINQIQVKEYKNASWKNKTDDNEIMVLHALAVDPLEKGKGCGRAFVAFYEDYAKQHGCIALRMDTNVLNTRARNLYQRLGYEEIGIVESNFNGIPNVRLVCLEKTEINL